MIDRCCPTLSRSLLKREFANTAAAFGVLVLLGFAVGILGTILFIRGLLQKGSVQYFQVDPEIKFNLKRLGLAALSMIVFFILWRTTHQFIVCVALVCFGLNAVFGRKLKYNIIYTVVFTAFIYAAFVVGFSVQFNR